MSGERISGTRYYWGPCLSAVRTTFEGETPEAVAFWEAGLASRRFVPCSWLWWMAVRTVSRLYHWDTFVSRDITPQMRDVLDGNKAALDNVWNDDREGVERGA